MTRLPWGQARLNLMIFAGVLRASKGHLFLSILGIALGVALGLCITLINRMAATEFAQAVQGLSGRADLVIRGARAGFAETLYPQVARMPEVADESPAIDLDVTVAGQRDPLEILCLDPFQVAHFKPALAPQQSLGMAGRLLAPDSLLLSHSAAQWLQLRVHDTVRLQTGLSTRPFQVAAILPAAAWPQRLGLMDIGACQWRFNWLGRLNRLDIRLRAGVDRRAFANTLRARLPAGLQVTTPQAAGRQAADMTSAYRTNLNVLSSVGLFTGIFLVFATQSLTIMRRRRQLALMRVLGTTQGGLLALLLMEGVLIGAAGALLGLGLGDFLTRMAVQHFGAELGAGYFRDIVARPQTEWGIYLAYFLMGVGAAVAGTLFPAWQASRLPPAQVLKAAGMQAGGRGRPWLLPGLALWGAALATAFAPPVHGLPYWDYVSIACLLIGTLLLLPFMIARMVALLPETTQPLLEIVYSRLRVTSGQAAVSIAAILVSFSLMVAMSIMVVSFRTSLATWLEKVLPADLYVRAAFASDTAWLTPQDQHRIQTLPGVRQADFLRMQSLYLRADRPPAVLIARTVTAANAAQVLALQSSTTIPMAALPLAWISEAMADLNHWRPGQVISLPIAGHPQRFVVAGIWRDYARQTGAVIINRQIYQQLSGDDRANEAALWLAPGQSAQAVAARLRASLPTGGNLEIFQPGEIRARSMQTFDRTFAITYLLEAIAVLIGLFGISSSFSAQALARRAEFGVLRHLGFTRRQIATLLGVEAALTSAIGIAAGLAVGTLISLILVEVVNRQSFHWSMDWRFPYAFLLPLALFLLAAAIMTAVISGRRAMGTDVIRAVKEDW